MTTNLYPFGVRLIDPADVARMTVPQLNTLNQTTGTIPANYITGGDFVVMLTTNATPGTQTTRTAVQMAADDPTYWPGQAYILRISNSGAGTLTLAGGSGVSTSGTMTVATNTFREFIVQYGTNAAVPTATITNIGLGTYT